MSKPWNKKHRKNKRLKGRCFRCHRRGGQKIECRTCRKLVDQGKLTAEQVFSRQFCPGCHPEAWHDMKKHVLTKHKAVAFLTSLRLGYEDPV